MELTTTQKLTMDSLEIARLTNKRHDHVLRDIEKMFDELEIDAPNFGDIYLDSQNRRKRKYNLTKDLTLTLISWYSIKLRKTIIDRWQELEAQSRKPQTYEEIMQHALLLADQRVKQLEAKIEEDKPKVEFADAVGSTEDGILLRDYCKILCDKGIDIGQNRLFKWLKNKGYLMADNRPYQAFTKFFSVKEKKITTIAGDRLVLTTYINGRWQEYFYKKLQFEF